MSRTRRFLQKKALENIPSPALDLVGKAVVEGVDQAVDRRWNSALDRAAKAEGDTVEERVRSVVKAFRREVSALGAVTGAVAAAPGLGTASAASALIADMGWFTMRATDLIMTVGAVHGYVESTPEQRRSWVLAVLAFGEEASDRFLELAAEMDGQVIAGEHVGQVVTSVVGSDAVTIDALRRINAELAAHVLTRYGSRRSLLAVGKLLPFGIGAAVGGSTNYAMGRLISGHASRFFAAATAHDVAELDS